MAARARARRRWSERLPGDESANPAGLVAALPAPAAIMTNAAFVGGTALQWRSRLSEQLRDAAEHGASAAAPMRTVVFNANRRESDARSRRGLRLRRGENAFIRRKRGGEDSLIGALRASFGRIADKKRGSAGTAHGAHRRACPNRGAPGAPPPQKTPADKFIWLLLLSASNASGRCFRRSAAR